MGLDATRKLPGEGYPREWPELVRMDERVRAKVDEMLKRWGI
jgi:4-hydroxy-3-polyprenylbenzoate decarboxylase